MCILFIHTNQNPPKGGYRLIVASNRDEFYKRPAQQAFHCPKTNIIGGRDLEPGREGGMWLGMWVAEGVGKLHFGALLNVTGEEHNKQATSGRGPLVCDYLKSKDDFSKFLVDLKPDMFSAFNLVAIEMDDKRPPSIYHHSNAPVATLQYTGNQTLAFGNSTPQSPLRKVEIGRTQFEAIITEGATKSKTQLIDALLTLLKSEERHLPDAELERRAPTSEFLSSIFVKSEPVGYGTRTHSIVLVDSESNVDFIEYTMEEPIDTKSPKWLTKHIQSHL